MKTKPTRPIPRLKPDPKPRPRPKAEHDEKRKTEIGARESAITGTGRNNAALARAVMLVSGCVLFVIILALIYVAVRSFYKDSAGGTTAVSKSDPNEKVADTPTKTDSVEKSPADGVSPDKKDAEKNEPVSDNLQIIAAGSDLKRTMGGPAISTLPKALSRATCVVPKRGSATEPGMGFCVKVDRPVTAYLAVHKCGTPGMQPAWAKTDLALSWEKGGDLIYKRAYNAGEIVVPVNATLAAKEQYALPHLLFLVPNDARKDTDLKVAHVKARTIAAEASGPLQLKATAAKMHGRVRLEQRVTRANIGYWIDAKDWVSWKARIPKAGRYRVSAEAACLTSGVPFVVELAGKKLDAKTTKTASYDEYSMVDIGVTEIAAVGPCEVKVRPKDAKSWKPINLRKLILAPEK